MTKRSKAPPRSAGVRLVLGVALAGSAGTTVPRVAHATEAVPVTLEEDQSSSSAPAPKKKEEEEPKVKRVIARYSLPWQLRPVLPTSMVRLDTTFSFYGVDGATIVPELSASYKIIPRLAIFARIALPEDSPPNGSGGFGVANPVIGGHLGFWPAKSWKLGLFLGLTAPIGMGGGTGPDKGSVDVVGAAMLARSGFENALFMPDYFTAWPGLDLAYVSHGFTLQGEVTLPFMSRVRGPVTEKSTNIDLTMGLHAGYFVFPFVAASVDFRHERWLTTPSFVAADPSREIRDLTTAELGLRFHVELTEDVTWRPGLAMSFGLDNPIAGSHYKTVRVDLPFSF